METMNIRKAIFALSVALGISVSLHAQTVSGRLVDEESRPMAFANVVILSPEDSSYVAGTVSREDGTFSLNNSSGQERLLRVSSVGYVTIYKRCSGGDMGVIGMRTDENVLGEVVVRSQLPVTRLGDEGLITNVEGSVLSRMGTANDVLARIPGLQRKKDGFEVFGKGTPLIYINGRKLRDKEELAQMSSEDIKSVEVIHNPGARYDASVGAVVRIRTVKRQGDGFGFRLSGDYNQSENTDLNGQADVNYRHGGLDVFGMVGIARYVTRAYDRLEQQTFADTLWTQRNNYRNDTDARTLRGRVGFNYDFNDRHSIGVRYDIVKTLRRYDNGTFKSDVQAFGEPYDVLSSATSMRSDAKPTHSLNAYYAGKIGKGELEWDADYYSSDNTDRSQNLENSAEHDDRTVTSENVVSNKLAATKLSFTHPLWGGSASVGGEYTFTDRHDDYINPEGYVPTSYSRIREHNLAAYVQYSHPLPFGQVSAGVRYEHVDFDYFDNGTFMPGQSRTYDNLFPNVSLSGQLGKVQFQLSYAARTQRPSYSQLSNNVLYANRFTWQTGNPRLKPTITHDITAVAAWRFVQAMVSYKLNRDYIFYWGTTVEGQSAVTLLNRINHGRLPQLTVFVSASPTIGPWNPSIGAGMLKQWLTMTAAGEERRYNKPVFMAQWNNVFNLPAGFVVNADFNFQSCGNVQNLEMKDEHYVLNIGVRKSLLNDALSLELRGNDLLHRMKDGTLMYFERAMMYDKSWSDTRSVTLTVRYKFNTARSKYRGTGAGHDAKGRM